MTAPLQRKKILVLGDKILALIGSAANASSYVIDTDKCTYPQELDEHIEEYGVIIVDEDIYNKCSNIKALVDKVFEKALVIVLQSPKKIGEIDYKKYYEEFVSKTIGLKISF
ncbi:hypothetical protein J4526_01085 [Desulfurococcaceae archaeon MEX13E-LK6-19]|nr:hypothetical protein J4526_01085 [Desulfurococcaceae archaeon MEX13E-LK6-19]